MTNNQIIRNEAARLDLATLHAIATAHHTPDEIAAFAAACKTTDENGNEQPATAPWPMSKSCLQPTSCTRSTIGSSTERP